jgi:hypothetical protein
MTDYSELKRLAEAATPGPWQTELAYPIIQPGYPARGSIASVLIWPDAHFIAAANPAAVLELIAQIERLERKNDNQAQTIREYSDLVMGGDVSLGMLRADLRVTSGERDQLKAEVAGLKTGYAAYEEENKALRKDAERYRWFRNSGDPDIAYLDFRGHIHPEALDEEIDSAMSKEAGQ